MFTEFLLGVAIVASLVMLVLLVAPRPNDDIRASRLPYVGIMLVVLLTALFVLGGFAIAA